MGSYDRSRPLPPDGAHHPFRPPKGPYRPPTGTLGSGMRPNCHAQANNDLNAVGVTESPLTVGGKSIINP